MTESRAVFLDRDGVINVERGYVHRREHFVFQEGIFELCRAAERLGYLLVVVTNQAGVARGFYTESDFLELTDWMIRQFADQHVHIARVYYCPYHPIHGVGEYKRESTDRKPNPGMILKAKNDLSLDLTSSVLIGDKLCDIRAGEAAGVATNILLRAGAHDLHGSDSYCHISDSLQNIRDTWFLDRSPTSCGARG